MEMYILNRKYGLTADIQSKRTHTHTHIRSRQTGQQPLSNNLRTQNIGKPMFSSLRHFGFFERAHLYVVTFLVAVDWKLTRVLNRKIEEK